jgi:hypothetical protein
LVPFQQCNAAQGLYRNITLKNIIIFDPPKKKKGIGVIIGNDDIPMEHVLFENVVVFDTKNPSYYCLPKGVESGQTLGHTHPVPGCLVDDADVKKESSEEIRTEL